MHAAEAKKRFDLPAGSANDVLRKFSEQSGFDVVFATDAPKGVRTKAVRGDYPPDEAVALLLDGTGLSASRDKTSGAFMVVRDPDPNVSGATQPIDRPETKHVEGRAIELDVFQVQGVREPGPVNQGVIPRSADRALAFQVFNREAVERSGAMSLGEFFRGLSSNSQPGLGYQTTYGASLNLASGPTDTSDRINLRGLGTNKTVVLLNGRRLYGSDSSGPDVSRIPLSAVDRIEVLAGAAAAIYGANAIGGAVNIITKKGYVGGEAAVYAGTSTQGGATEWHASLYESFSLNKGRTSGSILIEHVDRGALRAKQRSYWNEAFARIPTTSPVFRTILAPVLRTPQAAITTTSATGLLLPANPTATVTAVPVGYNNANPTALDFNATVGQVPISTRRVGEVFLQNPLRSESINLQGEQKLLRDRLEAYVEAAWRYQEVRVAVPGLGGTSGVLAATSPVNPFRAQPAAGFPVGVSVTATWDPIDLPFDPVFSLQRTARLVGGLKGKLGDGARQWAWAMDYSYDRNESYSQNAQNTAYLNQAVALGVYTPFRDLALYPNTTDLRSLQTININRNIPEIYVGNLRASGELWHWRGGAIALSVGGEQRREKVKLVGITDYPLVLRLNSPAAVAILAPTSNGQSNASRTSSAAYAEMTVPIVGAKNRQPLVEALEVSLAVRHEAYGAFGYRSTFGSGLASQDAPGNIDGTPVTLATRFQPVRDVSLRASYSDAFVAPTMTQLFNTRTIIPNSSITTFYDPVLGTTVSRPINSITSTSGGNPSLKPESGRGYNYGVILTPRWLKGFSASVDYFRVISYDQIRSPSLATILAFFPERVTRDASNQVTAYDTSSINMSVVVTSGADLGLSWDIDAGHYGTFTWSGTATYVDTFRLRAVRGNPFIKGVGDLTLDQSAPLRLKGQSSIFWTRQAITAGLTARYTGHYKSTYNSGAVGSAVTLGAVPIDGDFIASQLELDAQFTYRFAEQAAHWRHFLAHTTGTLGVRNLADRRPPYSSASAAFYSFQNDPRQRFVYVEVKRKF